MYCLKEHDIRLKGYLVVFEFVATGSQVVPSVISTDSLLPFDLAAP
jgi:hypothetical protein